MGSKIAHCLNCSVPNGAHIYCEQLADVLDENFDETGETQACIHYRHGKEINSIFGSRVDRILNILMEEK